jgi:hypothetical protein
MRPKHPGLLSDPELRESQKPRLADIPIDYVNAVRGEVLYDAMEPPPIELKLLLDPEVDMIE